MSMSTTTQRGGGQVIVLGCFPRELGQLPAFRGATGMGRGFQHTAGAFLPPSAEVSSPEGKLSGPEAPGEVDFACTSEQHRSQCEHWDDGQQPGWEVHTSKLGAQPACPVLAVPKEHLSPDTPSCSEPFLMNAGRLS